MTALLPFFQKGQFLKGKKKTDFLYLTLCMRTDSLRIARLRLIPGQAHHLQLDRCLVADVIPVVSRNSQHLSSEGLEHVQWCTYCGLLTKALSA